MKNKVIYKTINFIVLLITAVLFVHKYWNWADALGGQFVWKISILLVTVVLVNSLKMFRLYLALYGTGISLQNYLKTYCKVTPVSIMIPFKLGELFRIYCYGIEIENILKGMIVILLDRFMDTIALVTVVFALCIVLGGHVVSLVYLLVFFLIMLTIVYLVFPGLHKFWKKYLIDGKSSAHKIWTLESIEKINSLYVEIEGVVRGRGILMYGISIVAWIIEIANVAISARGIGKDNLTSKINQYLVGSLGKESIPEINKFGFVSIIFMVVFYIIIEVISKVRGSNK